MTNFIQQLIEKQQITLTSKIDNILLKFSKDNKANVKDIINISNPMTPGHLRFKIEKYGKWQYKDIVIETTSRDIVSYKNHSHYLNSPTIKEY